MKKLYQVFAGAVSLAMAAVMGVVTYYSTALPDHFYVAAGAAAEGISIGTALEIQGEIQPISAENGTASLTVLGGIAVKQVDVQFVDREMVIPCGYPFGIKMFTEGVVVVGLTDVEENGIFRNPAQEAGIRVGDVLTELDGQPVSLNEDVAAIITSSGGREISYTLKRKNQTLTGYGLQPIRAAQRRVQSRHLGPGQLCRHRHP